MPTGRGAPPSPQLPLPIDPTQPGISPTFRAVPDREYLIDERHCVECHCVPCQCDAIYEDGVERAQRERATHEP